MCGFLFPVLTVAQRRLLSIIRPRQSTAAASALFYFWGPSLGLYRTRSICTPVSAEAARRPLLSSSLSSEGFRKGASTSSKKKKARPSLLLSKMYNQWIRRYKHNPKHFHSGFRVAYVCYSHYNSFFGAGCCRTRVLERAVMVSFF